MVLDNRRVAQKISVLFWYFIVKVSVAVEIILMHPMRLLYDSELQYFIGNLKKISTRSKRSYPVCGMNKSVILSICIRRGIERFRTISLFSSFLRELCFWWLNNSFIKTFISTGQHYLSYSYQHLNDFTTCVQSRFVTNSNIWFYIRYTIIAILVA